MNPRVRGWLAVSVKVVGGFTVAVGLLALANSVRDLSSRDALANLRSGNDRMDNRRPTISLTNVAFRQYNGDRPVADGQFDQVEVTQDRQVVLLHGIRQGRYQTAKGEFRFEAPSATWLQIGRQLHVDGPARVWNRDLDLQAKSATYAMTAGQLVLNEEFGGRFFGGQLTATNLRYQPGDGMWSLGPVSWQGTPPKTNDLPVTAKGKWTIRASGAKRLPGDLEEWRTAEATDGEVVVKADRMERNVRTDVLVATGNVRYFSPDANVLAERVTIDRRAKRALLEGNVSMLIKPEGEQRLEVVELRPLVPVLPEALTAGRPVPEGADPTERTRDDEVRDLSTRRKYPLQIRAGRIDTVYAKGRRSAVATGQPQARQEMAGGRWRQLWAPTARYDRERETLRLEGPASPKAVRVKTSLGDDLRSVWFLASTKEGDDTWEAEGLEGDVAGGDEDLNDLRDKRDTTPPPPTKPAVRGRIGA